MFHTLSFVVAGGWGRGKPDSQSVYDVFGEAVYVRVGAKRYAEALAVQHSLAVGTD